MCYKRPGPRCTSHAKKRLAAADKAVSTAIRRHGEGSVQAQKAYERWREARAAWDATPGGQEELAVEIARMEAERDLLVTQGQSRREERLDLDIALSELRYRADTGAELRAKQLKAYKFHQRYASGFRPSLSPEWGDARPLERSWETAEGDTISVFKHWDSRASHVRHAWVIRDGEPVAMVHFFEPTRQYADLAMLCDIEVSPFHRGEGLSRRLVEEVSNKYGQLHTSGTFSVTGHAALAGYVPVVPGGVARITDTEAYEFVDWENGTLMHP